MEFIKENISWIAPVGGWVLAILAFVITPVRDWIVGKVKRSLDKAKENNKALNDKKLYVSKARFDKEFEIHQNIIKSATFAYRKFRCFDFKRLSFYNSRNIRKI